MTVIVVTAAAAVVAGALGWSILRVPLSADAFRRTNFRGNSIPATAGVVVALVGAGGSLVLLAVGDVEAAVAFAGFQAAAGFGVLGFLDDMGGQPGGGGFGGHLRALKNGKVTTGLVKAVLGGLLALMVAGIVTDGGGVAGWLRDGAIVALAANLANLFDRAPARTTKVAVLAAVALVLGVVAGSGDDGGVAIGVLGVGAAVGLAPWELRERLMQGDTGANVVGGLLGLGAAAELGSTALWALVVVLFALNLASEKVSFSKVIDATAPLRWFDRLGRPAP